MYQKAVLFFGILGVTLSLVLGLSLVITWQIVAVLIAVSMGIPTLILSYEKLKLIPEVSAKPKEEKTEQDIITEEKEILREETIRVSPHNAAYYVFELKRGETLKGEISSDTHIDIYFVNNINFKKWDKDKTFEFEYCNESVLETKIDYEVPKRGTWYLVIENNGRKSTKVKVCLY